MDNKHEKPPLGIVPRHIWEESRLDDIVIAIRRYLNAWQEIPIEWIEEYNELIESISNYYLKNNY